MYSLALFPLSLFIPQNNSFLILPMSKRHISQPVHLALHCLDKSRVLMLLIRLSAKPCLFPFPLSHMNVFDLVLKGSYSRLSHHKNNSPRPTELFSVFLPKRITNPSLNASQSFQTVLKKATLYPQLEGECEILFT